MKHLILVGVTVATLCLAFPATAQQQSPSKAAQAQGVPDTKAFDKQMAEAQAQMKRMQEQMDRMRQTQDPNEQQRLLQEHWATMQSAMATMHGMWGPGMMGGQGMMGDCCAGPGMMGGHGTMGWNGMRSHYSTLTPEQQRQRQYMTDQYLGMQQMMMDHMLMRQQWMMQPPTIAPSK